MHCLLRTSSLFLVTLHFKVFVGMMEQLALLMERTSMKEEWRSAAMEFGGLSMTVDGIPEREKSFVDNLDTKTQVTYLLSYCLM